MYQTDMYEGMLAETITMPGANHAFFNDTGGNYDEASATEAWRQVLVWFDEHLG